MSVSMDPQAFIFDTPLYHWVEVDDASLELLATDYDRRYYPRYDGYNPVAKCDSTYQLDKGFRYSNVFRNQSISHDTFVELRLSCTRKKDVMLIFVQADYEQMKIRKIGQYPSVADIHIAQIKQYSKVVNKEDQRDLAKAIGLAANGVGIGSFVYLRRIFENLIIEASETCIANGLVDRNKFEASRMDEKISLLRTELPEFLYENRKIYGIISKGIHELTENECLSMFDVLRSSIEMILEEKLAKYQKEQKKKELQKNIDKISKQLTNK